MLRPAWQELAIEQNLEIQHLDTTRFRHVVLVRDEPGKHLHIYVEGDGTPWIRNRRVAVDPTPTNPVLLELMQYAPGTAVYLGRPCYFGLSTSKGCEPRLWTADRYGTEIVESMCLAANTLAQQYDAESVELIGYSGGGAIVAGMRTCTNRLIRITTIAANLDPAAWADYHGFLALDDIEPVESAIMHSGQATETHWQCKTDEKIPPSVTDRYFLAQEKATRQIVDSCTHASGWRQYLSQIISGSTGD